VEFERVIQKLVHNGVNYPETLFHWQVQGQVVHKFNFSLLLFHVSIWKFWLRIVL